MKIPASTYRIQLHEKFNFSKLEEIIDYLHELGISTIYASPVTQAIKGSTHGYDVTNPGVISPEIGTEEEMAHIAQCLAKYNMTWVQDIVPNHMAYEVSNPWVLDVLKKGEASPYFRYFDIEQGQRIMVPFLGKTLTECLLEKDIQLEFRDGEFVVRYFDAEYPLDPASWSWICTARPGAPAGLVDLLANKPDRLQPDAISASFIGEQVSYFNEHPTLLQELLDQQHYVLTHFHLAVSAMNYRRFFTVSSLICLRMEDPVVFDDYHRQIRSWYEKGYIQGLRVDHIDGLAAPAAYVAKLREVFGADCYIVCEKILGPEEPLPKDWQLQGATGYEFLAEVSQLLTDADGYRQIKRFYKDRIVPDMPAYDELVFEKKLHFLKTYMGGELDNLVRRGMEAIAHAEPEARQRFREALAVFMSSFPVYRLYPDPAGDGPLPDISGPLSAVSEADRPTLAKALQDRAFLSRVMQFTGPLAAKGIEDTTFYVYNALIGRNEVGDSPAVEGLDAAAFHQRMQRRQQDWPHAMNAGTTHDTKRGEDSRIRLLWLSAVPDEWQAAVTRWQDLHQAVDRPSPNDEYFIYQSLLASFPPDMTVTDLYRQRFHDMLTKALREAKAITSWDKPDEGYEQTCHSFSDRLLDTATPFMEDFMPFARRCMDASYPYVLAQTLLKLTAPGVPDIYQGAELWDLSLVDPDNRRPVDYSVRRKLLEEIRTTADITAVLGRRHHEGIGKLYTIYQTLQYRNAHRKVFEQGGYEPVDAEGPYLAYIRRQDGDAALIVVPLVRMRQPDSKEAILTLQGSWTNLFTGEKVAAQDGLLKISLEKFPVALLTAS